MNKIELIQQISHKTSLNNTVTGKILTATIQTIISETAAGKSVQLAGFGTFEARLRKERTGHNPVTGEMITIPESKVPAFKPAKIFKDMVKKQ